MISKLYRGPGDVDIGCECESEKMFKTDIESLSVCSGAVSQEWVRNKSEKNTTEKRLLCDYWKKLLVHFEITGIC